MITGFQERLATLQTWGALKALPHWNNRCRGEKKEYTKHIVGTLRIRRNDIWRSCANI